MASLQKIQGIATQEQERISSPGYFFHGTDRKPRYYQQIAIIDFRNITDLFAAPDFDGDAVRVKDFGVDDDLDSPKDEIYRNVA